MTRASRIAARLCCVALAACAASGGGWTKPGADATASEREYQACLAQAKQAIAPEIGMNEDILATRSGDWQRASTLPIQRSNMTEQTKARAQYILAQCMRAKGFRPAG